MHGSVAIPEELKGNELIVFTDSNWGPQDASKPKPNETRTVTLEELKSIQGYYITRMGGMKRLVGMGQTTHTVTCALHIRNFPD